MARVNEWTDEEVALLRQLYESQVTFDEIKVEFPNRSSNAIRLKASRLGLKRPTIQWEDVYEPSIFYRSGKNLDPEGMISKCSQCGSWVMSTGVEASIASPRCESCSSD